MVRKTTLQSEHGCKLVLVEQLDVNGFVLSTSYEVVDSSGNAKPYSDKLNAKAAYLNRVYEVEQRLGYSGMRM